MFNFDFINFVLSIQSPVQPLVQSLETGGGEPSAAIIARHSQIVRPLG